MGNLCSVNFYVKPFAKSGTAEDLVVLYSVKGKTVVTITGKGEVWIDEENLIAINPKEQYSVEIASGIMAAIEFSREEIYRLLHGRLRMVDCCSVDVKNGTFSQVQDKIKKLLNAQFSDAFSEVAFEKNSYELLLTLFSEYSSELAMGDRKSEVSGWIEHSFRDVITLENAADYFHLTPQYFSSWFAETFDTTFVKYLAKVRCKNAKRELVDGDDTILRIALENGFPNAGSFTKAFVSLYGQTPLQYRKAHAKTTEEYKLRPAEVTEYLANEEESQEHIDEVRIECSGDLERLDPYWTSLCNVSDMQGLTDREIQDQLLDMQRGISFRCARVVLGVPGDVEETGFYSVDKAIEFFMEMGVEAIFVIDYRRCSTHPGFIEWMRELTRHIIHRYGYRTIRLEVVYDTMFDHKKSVSYKRFIQKLEEMVTQLNVTAVLYGPGLLLNRNGNNLSACLKAEPDLDVVTIRCAPLEIDSDDNMLVRRVTDTDYIIHQYSLAKEIARFLGFSDNVMITGWKNSLTGFDILNDSCWAAAHIIRSALKGYGILPSLPLDDPLDLMQADPARQKLFYGAPGLMTVSRLKKPSFYAYQFLSHLDNYYLYHNEHFIVTTSNGEYFQILLQNGAPLSYRYYMEDQEEIDRVPEEYFDSRESYRISLYLEGVPSGRWFVKSRMINEEEGSVYNTWISMNYADLSFWGRDETKMLEASSFPHMEGSVVESKDGVIELTVSMQPNEIRHLHLIPIR